ncbi:hypothetical protein Achl_4218 (plasmid) [Pseudarthrobacter chlorophenolicus A6]|uniref:Uncharacterized protein n=1 Tax=Pseudarthrobacter chlorophenolicus (strain ATCC 700700 / DSM 12829 / CIP 107037 / JCM 12360 / KCTC 9906 / NCIMB 13794 / A6) TaxID=452863 RepID=B8HIC2_PSECP|nr:hypothetical protein [Pseudarthrobacter chlorophenolicus]ACL42169.1 hypothetical protein Achl_4218 [Pseudarthrobacter chlorophenolicus A6]SDQ14352.1 hypothetical protein SAMN04489738_0276 [Pseudarthrobacter chlorophenolicus]
MGLDEEIARIQQQADSAASETALAADIFRKALRTLQGELRVAAQKLAAADVPLVPVLAMTEDPREGDTYRFPGPVDHGKQAWPINGDLALTREGVLLAGVSLNGRHPSMATHHDRRYSGLWEREAAIGLEPGETYLGHRADQVPEVDLDVARPVISHGSRANISPQGSFPFSLRNGVLFYSCTDSEASDGPALEILAKGVLSLLADPPTRRPPLSGRPRPKEKKPWWRR